LSPTTFRQNDPSGPDGVKPLLVIQDVTCCAKLRAGFELTEIRIQHDLTTEHWDLVRKNGGDKSKIFGILTIGLEH